MSLSLCPLDESGFGAVVDCNLSTGVESHVPQGPATRRSSTRSS